MSCFQTTLSTAHVTSLILCYSLLLAGCSQQVEPHFKRGESLFQAGKAEEAIDAFSEAIRLDPQFAAAYLGRGCAYVLDGKFEKALRDFDFAETHLEDSSILLRYRGIALLELNRPYEAAEALTESMEFEAFNASALRMRGLAREMLGDTSGALADFIQAILITPENCELYIDRASLRLQNEELETALADANQAVQLCPTCSLAYAVRSLVHQASQQWEASQADRRMALSIDPGLRRVQRSGLMGGRRPLVLQRSEADLEFRTG